MGAGLLGGVAAGGAGLLAYDAFENHEQREQQQAYDQGYQNGNDGQGVSVSTTLWDVADIEI